MAQTAAVIALSIICFLFIIFVARKPGKITKFLGNSAIRMTIAVLFLFFFNVFAQNFGWHIPINVFTVLVTSVLGLFGLGTLLAVHLFLL